MRIGVIGAGSMGEILARHFAKLGHHVSMATPRTRRGFTPRPFPIRPSARCTAHRETFRRGRKGTC